MSTGNTWQLQTGTAEETRALGRRLGRGALPGDVFYLEGELGAGKTTLLQGLGEALAVTEPVTSPSFSLLHFHPGPLPLYHADLYRLAPDEVADIGLEEAFAAPGVVAIEWAERLPLNQRAPGLRIAISYGEEPEARQVTLIPEGARAEALAAQLVAESNG
jgi:tRNA threonylcarbamoyladenosine biosynthesis protein TsaE